MASRGIRHIDVCDDCLEAEFLLWIFDGIFGSSCVRVLCKSCAKKRGGKVDYVRERW
jgi:hypothetical protein